MSKYAQGQFQIRNPEKYVGKKTPTYRSGWEFVFMQFCDNNDNILQWASESISIPYRNPLTGKNTIYIPDFFINNKGNKNLLIPEYPRGANIDENRFPYLKRFNDPGEWHREFVLCRDVDKNLAYKVQKETEEQVIKLIEKAIEKCEYNVVVAVERRNDAVMKHLAAFGYNVSYYCDRESGYYRISWR